jgi:ubiquinone/menaquinone biosynthesis C-methylase UbiE
MSEPIHTKERIRQYWEDRAAKSAGSAAATTDDIHMRELEVATLIETIKEIPLPASAKILDVGCGDGHSTVQVSQEFPNLAFLGIDYSPEMIRTACRELDLLPDLKGRLKFTVGDVESLDQVCGDTLFDVVVSDRCLINLESAEHQIHALAEIAKHTQRGGTFIAIENFVEGQRNMNEARKSVGLPPIPVRWHNRFFSEEDFVRSVSPYFGRPSFRDFSSSYYFATRVIYSAMCTMRGEVPDYDHEIHRLAVHLPWIGMFSPIRLAVMWRRGGSTGDVEP